jgi:DNA primase
MPSISDFFKKYIHGFDQAVKTGETQVIVKCPFHSDLNPSFSVNTASGLWKCHTGSCPTNVDGKGGGNMAQFLVLLKGIDIDAAKKQTADYFKPTEEEKKERKKDPTLGRPSMVMAGFPYNEDDIERWCVDLFTTDKPLKCLLDDCLLTVETLRKWRIGYDGERITIPIYENKRLVNVRRYSSKPPNKAKFMNVPKFGRNRLWPIENLEENPVYIFEGEKDCLLANQLGIPGVTATAGCGNFDAKWAPMFKDKDVYVCYDLDSAGRDGAAKVVSILGRVATRVSDVVLPITEPANGDFTDYIKKGHTADEFRKLCEESSVVHRKIKVLREIPDEVAETNLYDAVYDSAYHQRRVKFKVMVTGHGLEMYAIPSNFRFICKRELGDQCTNCGVGHRQCDANIQMTADNPLLLSVIETSSSLQLKMITDFLNIPKACTFYEMPDTPQTYIERVSVIPAFDDGVPYVDRPIESLGLELHTNREYELTCVAINNPKTQKLVHIAYEAKPSVSSIDEFKMNAKLKRKLEVFQCG